MAIRAKTFNVVNAGRSKYVSPTVGLYAILVEQIYMTSELCVRYQRITSSTIFFHS